MKVNVVCTLKIMWLCQKMSKEEKGYIQEDSAVLTSCYSSLHLV
jgi:hypothetical protein